MDPEHDHGPGGGEGERRAGFGPRLVVPVLVGCGDGEPAGGFAALVGGDERFLLVDTVEAGRQVVAAARAKRPEVVLVDQTRRVGLSGAALVVAVLAACPDTCVVVRADTGPDQVLAVIAAGARGYVACDEPPQAALDLLYRVGLGEIALSDAAVEALCESVRRLSLDRDAVPSDLELRILEVLAGGVRPRALPHALSMSPKAAKTELRRLFDKLGVHDRAAAVAEALRRGWAG